jgi:hypothetical protein
MDAVGVVGNWEEKWVYEHVGSEDGHEEWLEDRPV